MLPRAAMDSNLTNSALQAEQWNQGRTGTSSNCLREAWTHVQDTDFIMHHAHIHKPASYATQVEPSEALVTNIGATLEIHYLSVPLRIRLVGIHGISTLGNKELRAEGGTVTNRLWKCHSPDNIRACSPTALWAGPCEKAIQLHVELVDSFEDFL